MVLGSGKLTIVSLILRQLSLIRDKIAVAKFRLI
jgi:hypothetical protein